MQAGQQQEDEPQTPLSRLGTDVYAEGEKLREKQERVQTKTFTKWWNSHLKERNLKIDVLFEDVKSGIMLANLLEVISGAKLEGKLDKNPKFLAQQVVNLELCWALLKTKLDPKSLVSVGPKDVAEGNPKLILGLTWLLILRFELSKFSADIQELLKWVKKRTHGYKDVHVESFTNGFQDGLALNALIHAHFPELVDFDGLNKDDAINNLNNAFDVAEKHLGVPKLLDAVDVANEPDEKSMITYLARLRQAMNEREEALRKKEADEEARRKALLAEEEARRKALQEEEARRKAEEDAARRAAEEEARRQAEEEARRLAELAAQKAKEEARRKALEDLQNAAPLFLQRAAREAETDQKNKDFDKLAEDLANWIKDKNGKLKDNADYKQVHNPEEVAQLLKDTFDGKKPGEDFLFDAHALANELDTRHQLEGRPQPAHPIGIKDLGNQWDGLSKVYDGYKAGLLDHLKQLKDNQPTYDRIRRFQAKLGSWHAENEAAIKSTEVGASIAEVTALIGQHDRLTKAAQAELSLLKKVDELIGQLKDSVKPADIVSTQTAVHAKYTPLPEHLAKRTRDLQASLEKQKQLEAQRVAFHEATKSLAQLVFEAEDITGHAPLPADTDASLKTLIEALNKSAHALAKAPEGVDPTEADDLVAKQKALVPKLEALRFEVKSAQEKKAKLEDAQKKYAKAAQQFHDWFTQQTNALETPVPSLDVLKFRVQASQNALPDGNNLLTGATAASAVLDQVHAANNSASTPNPFSSYSIESLNKEYESLKSWVGERVKLIETGIVHGDKVKVVSSLNVLTENKGSVSGADLQSYLPSEQADYFQSKFKANGDDSFAYTGFAVVPGGISSAAAASNATYAGPSSVASTPTASPYTTPSKSAAASSTPATPNFNASPVRTPLNIASPAAVRASTASPAVSSPSVYKAPAALSVDTTPTKTSSFPEFDNNLRMRKAYDDGITMLTTENDDKILRFELENAGTKAYEFTMNFTGSTNLELIYPKQASLKVTMVILPGETKTLAIINPQVNPRADSSTRRAIQYGPV